MTNQEKINALYEIFKNLNSYCPNTHLALVRKERIRRAFYFYGPKIMWTGREEELILLYDQFIEAKTYTNEFGKTGFDMREIEENEKLKSSSETR